MNLEESGNQEVAVIAKVKEMPYEEEYRMVTDNIRKPKYPSNPVRAGRYIVAIAIVK